jgi:hypothetical protein
MGDVLIPSWLAHSLFPIRTHGFRCLEVSWKLRHVVCEGCLKLIPIKTSHVLKIGTLKVNILE